MSRWQKRRQPKFLYQKSAFLTTVVRTASPIPYKKCSPFQLNFYNESFAHAQAPFAQRRKLELGLASWRGVSLLFLPRPQLRRIVEEALEVMQIPFRTPIALHAFATWCRLSVKKKKGRLIDIVRLFSSLELCFRWTSSLVSVHRLHVLHKLKTTVQPYTLLHGSEASAAAKQSWPLSTTADQREIGDLGEKKKHNRPKINPEYVQK